MSLKSFFGIWLWILIIAFGGLALFYFLVLDGTVLNPVIAIENNDSLQPVKNEYRRGEMVQVYISYCKYRPIIPVVTDTLSNTYQTFYTSESKGTTELGCYKNKIINLQAIPMTAEEGSDYHFARDLSYRLNNWRNLQIPMKTKLFKIIP